MSTTRRQLRQWVGRLTSEMILCTATAAGDTRTFIDAVKLAQENNTLNGREAICSGGTAANLGLVRRVAGNSKSATSVTLAPDLPAATSAGDQLELWNELDVASSIDEVHDLINFYIAGVAQVGREIVDSTQTFDWTSPALAIPASWEAFSGADYEDVYGVWRPLPDFDLDFDRGLRTVTLRGTAARISNGRSIRLRGLDAADPLANDDATTTIDAEWLAHQVAGQLLISHSMRNLNPQLAQQLGNFYLTRADALRTKTAGRTNRAAHRL